MKIEFFSDGAMHIKSETAEEQAALNLHMDHVRARRSKAYKPDPMKSGLGLVFYSLSRTARPESSDST